MGNDDLARMLVAVMDAGGVPEFDLCNAKEAHVALVFLTSTPAGESACARMHVPVVTLPDPDVGLRVRGLTQALWSAVGLDFLRPMNGGSMVRLTLNARHEGREFLKGLPEAERAIVAQAGHRWACRSTSRKTRASGAGSPAVA